MEDKLFDKYSFQYENNFFLSDEGFRKALAEYKQSIIGLIDKMILRDKKLAETFDNDDWHYSKSDTEAYSSRVTIVLDELKQKIEEL